MESISGNADHLVVLIHGLWGNPGHLKYLVKALREKHSEDKVHILVPKSNADNFTYDGIETGGERTTHEIEEEIKKIEDRGITIRKLSIVGYSMGGLIARYAVGLLYSAGLFDRVEPVNFTTFATPHLGVRAPLTGTGSQIWNTIGPMTLSTSGRQMFTIDSFRDYDRPLLGVMADKDSVFIRGLASFRHRTLYSNIINDRSVVYYTANIDDIDPYVDMDAVALNTIPGTEGVILDPEDPVRPKTKADTTALGRVTETARGAIRAVPFFLFMTLIAPIGATVFLTNAGIQSFRSTQRVKLHESGGTGVTIERYRRAPFLLNEMRNVADRLYNHAAVTASQDGDYLPTPPPEAADHLDVEAKGGATTSTKRAVAKSGRSSWPKLALTPEQFDMIEALDTVGFTKYRVHITKVSHSHAAIIVRQPWRPGFGEGRVVVKHWVENLVV